VYLTVAERTGLVGLAVYLVVLAILLTVLMVSVVASFRLAPPRDAESEREWSVLDAALLGGAASVVGASFVGLADHYYFNIEFPHMAALFWLSAAVALTARRLLIERQEKPLPESGEGLSG
jgi:hypothetical protein